MLPWESHQLEVCGDRVNRVDKCQPLTSDGLVQIHAAQPDCCVTSGGLCNFSVLQLPYLP